MSDGLWRIGPRPANNGRRHSLGPPSPLSAFYSFPIKLPHEPTQPTGLPLHFLVVGFVATPFSAADSSSRSLHPFNRNLSPSEMDDNVQQYEPHASPACSRDRLCVSLRLLSPLNLPTTWVPSLCVAWRMAAVQAKILWTESPGLGARLRDAFLVLGPRIWAPCLDFIFPSRWILRPRCPPPPRPTSDSRFFADYLRLSWSRHRMLTSSFSVSSEYELIVRQEPKQARMCGVGSECCGHG